MCIRFPSLRRTARWTVLYELTFCLRRPFATGDVFVCHFEQLLFVFHIVRSSSQLLQHLHAKTNCLAPAGSAIILVHLHPRLSVTAEVYSFLRPALRYCITSIRHLFFVFFSFSSKTRTLPVLRNWPTRILEGGPVAIALIAATNQIRPFFLSLWRSCQLDVTMISSVARGGGGRAIALPHWHVHQNAEWEKHYVFSTYETVLCTEVD